VEVHSPQEQGRLLWARITEATGDPRIRAWVAQVMRERGVRDGRDVRALTAALQGWVQQHIRYLREEPDTLVHPARTLEWGVGDCDDMSILLGTALRSVRIPVRLVLLGWSKEPGPIPLRHVYTEAQVEGRWTPLETVRAVPLGWSPEAYKQRQGFRTRRLEVSA
jgi:transglutaminase-like putative cysteine protease